MVCVVGMRCRIKSGMTGFFAQSVGDSGLRRNDGWVRNDGFV
jgi:hypothetical protein